MILAIRAEWNGPQPTFTSITPNLEGPGLMGIGDDGAVYKILVPSSKHRDFSAVELFPPGTAKRFIPWHGRILIETPDGHIGVATGTTGSAAPNLTPIAYPIPLQPEAVYPSLVGRSSAAGPAVPLPMVKPAPVGEVEAAAIVMAAVEAAKPPKPVPLPAARPKHDPRFDVAPASRRWRRSFRSRRSNCNRRSRKIARRFWNSAS